MWAPYSLHCPWLTALSDSDNILVFLCLEVCVVVAQFRPAFTAYVTVPPGDDISSASCARGQRRNLDQRRVFSPIGVKKTRKG